MLNFLKLAQRQLHDEKTEYEADVSFEDAAIVNAQQDNAFLKERNRHLEAKVARLHDMLRGVNSELARRENVCDSKAAMVNAAIKKLNSVKQNMPPILQQVELQLQAAKEQRIRDLQRIRHGQRQLEELRKANEQLEYRSSQLVIALKKAEQRITKLEGLFVADDGPSAQSLQGEYYKKRGVVTSFGDSPAEEEYIVSSISARQAKNHGHSMHDHTRNGNRSPFGYSPLAKSIYLRGLQPDHSEERITTLEEKVENLSEQILGMKAYLEKICQTLAANNSEKATNYGSIENFINSDDLE